jgi:hypothetical protein
MMHDKQRMRRKSLTASTSMTSLFDRLIESEMQAEERLTA